MKVTYLYHSGFAVEFEDRVLIFDYYRGELPKIAKDKKLYVFSSHSHKDHFQKSVFDWADTWDAIYILSKDIRAKGPEGRVRKVRRREELVIDDMQIKTLRSTDIGVAFFVRYGGITIYHAGDLNWWHWEEESEAYNKKMKHDYQKEIDSLEGAYIDLAFLPLDPRLGEAYNWGLDYFMRHTDTSYVFPMHLWGGYKTIDQLLKEPQTGDYAEKIQKITRENREFEIDLRG